VGWKFMSAEIPYARHGSRAWERHFSSMRGKYSLYSVHTISNGDEVWIAPQIIAEAKSRLAAQRAFNLLQTALTIIDGTSSFEMADAVVVPRDRKHLEDLSPDDLLGSRHTVSRDNVVLGCRLAAALSRRNFSSYAAFKLSLSYRIASVHWMELHPRFYPKKFGVSDSRSDHVQMASAITLAYLAFRLPVLSIGWLRAHSTCCIASD
ncbi:MAG: hypothetical protein JWQ07_5974, partial [Ramlibacter sp.]|nr:hypothetical protein [Ramlibacter sp.]